MTDRFIGMTRLQRIGETLYPNDPTYSAEPLDIDDARWLFDHVNGCPETPALTTDKRDDLEEMQRDARLHEELRDAKLKLK